MPPTFKGSIPFFKPPYARVVAIDLNNGTIAWKVPFGDLPALREEIARLGVQNIPEKLGVQGPPGALVTRGGLLFIGGGDTMFHAMDKMTGKDVWTAPTKETTGTPMTYQTRSGRQFVLVCTGRSTQATLAAFALPPGTAPSAALKPDRERER
jgi:quinoprotein glucose dehydrogenase